MRVWYSTSRVGAASARSVVSCTRRCALTEPTTSSPMRRAGGVISTSSLPSNRVLERFTLGGGRCRSGTLGAQHLPAEPVHRRLEGEPRSCARLVEDGGKLPSLQPIRVGAAGFEARRPFEEPRDQGMVEVLW